MKGKALPHKKVASNAVMTIPAVPDSHRDAFIESFFFRFAMDKGKVRFRASRRNRTFVAYKGFCTVTFMVIPHYDMNRKQRFSSCELPLNNDRKLPFPPVEQGIFV